MAMVISMLPLTGQVQCHDGFKAFIPGEKLSYRASYHWGLIWIDAADVEFELSNATFSDQQAFHIISTGTSFKRWDWLFKVRDTFEVYVDQQSLKPLWHKRHTSEGGYVIHNLYHFDYQNNTIIAEIEETRKPFHTKLIPMKNCTYDVLGASYVVRSLDYSQMEKGERFTVNMVVDDQVFALPVIYQGIETIRNRDRQQYECIAIDAILDEGTMFKPGEALRIWLSNDDNRIPVMMEAKVRVGSVKVYLTDFDKLKAPLTSLR
jgi:hypothetical protein